MNVRINRRTTLGLVGGLGGAALLAACTGGPEESGPPAKQVPAPTAAGGTQAESCGVGAWEPTYPSGFSKYDPPVKIDATWQPTSGLKFNSGDSFTDNPMYNRLRDTLGIEYNAKFQADTSVWAEKMSQVIVSGDLPDVFPLGGTDLPGFIDNEGAEDIREIWDATASPLVKEKREYPDGEAWAIATRGDALYGVPFTYGPAYNVDNIGFVRGDLLDKIGAELPKTVDEVGEVLRELHGKGLVEFGIAATKKINTYTGSLDPIFGAYGSMPKKWLDDGSGKLVYGSIQPAVREALAVLAAWYKQGLMDPDFYTRTEQDVSPQFTSGKQAIVYTPWWSGTPFATQEASDPGVRWEICGSPAGPGGKRGRASDGPATDAMVFKSGVDRQKVEAVINQLNWSTEMHANWSKYHQYGEYTNSTAWTEGYEYVLDGCEMAVGPVPTQYGYVNLVGFNFPALAYPSYQFDVFQDIQKMVDLSPDEQNLPQAYLLKNKALLRTIETYSYVYQTKDESVASAFTGSPTETMLKSQSDLDQMELEVFTKLIVGQAGPEAFDTFVNDWRSNGGDKITDEVNAWKQARG